MDYTKCESASEFEAKFRELVKKLDVVEHEETWQQIDDALKGLISLVKAGVTKFDTFVPTIKQADKYITSAVLSERTRLSGTALQLVEEMARSMETRFTAISELLFPPVMKTCGRANKVFVTRGIKCLTQVITYAHVPEQTPRICDAVSNDVNKTVRSSAAKLLMSIISCCTVPELNPHLAVVEKAIASGVVDANPDARTTARQSYEIYIKRFSNRVESFHNGLSTTAKKYLKIEDKGNGGRPQSQFSSFRQQRQPLRDRIMAQRPGVKPAGDGQTNTAQQPSSEAVAINRPKPVRPVARQAPVAVRRDGTSAPIPLAIVETGNVVVVSETAQAVSAADSVLTPVTAASVAAAAPPTMTARSSTVERLLLSPGGAKPAMSRLLNDESQSSGEKSPVDSAHAPSVSPTVTAPASRGPSPPVSRPLSASASVAGDDEITAVEGSKPTTPPATEPSTAADSDKLSVENADKQAKVAEVATAAPTLEVKKDQNTTVAVPKGPVATKAKRAPGLKFSSLNGSATGPRAVRVPHAQRPQSRNLVSTRVEEALRAQRPVQTTAGTADSSNDVPKRMTLRSDNRASTGAPGYLRATASSSKRVTGECEDDD
ncbi:hypothetical protein GGI07_003969 [Coemansia sp. Benny D115]|nr:hypothetical protein GGI07_003969 [Coemansia sp. Benny D115]